MANLRLKAGDDQLWHFVITDSGTAVDLTGGTIYVKIAKNILVSDNLALFYDSFTTFTDAVNGIHDEVIAKETTATWGAGNYLYQVRFVDSGGITRSEEIGNCVIEAVLFS